MLARRALVVGLTSVIAMLAAGCSGGGGYGSSSGSADAPPETRAAPTSTTVLTASGFAFQPASLEVSEGSGVTFENADSVAHTFTVNATDVDAEAEPGEQVEVSLEGLSPGDYTFHCDFHSQMKGTLTVT